VKNDVCLSPGVALSENRFMPPAGDFLSLLKESTPSETKKKKLLGKLPPEAKQKRLSENFPSKAKQPNQLNRFMARSGPCEINTSAASPARSSASISTF
jgi:hypothetical protein